MNEVKKLYEGDVRKNYLLFAIPLILSALLSQSYSFVNSMMIGQFIGSEAFSATAVTAEFIEFLNSIFFGYLTGIGIYVSVLFGKGDYEKMLNVIKLNFLMSTSLAIVISIVCNLFCNQIFDILNVNEEVYKNAESYFRIYSCSYIVLQFNWGFTYISNGMGLTKMPLATSVTTGIINVALNYLFLGVLGKNIGYSALATIIASSVSTVIYFYIYTKLFKNMGVRNVPLKISKNLLYQSIEYGSPSALQQMAMYACTAMISPLTNTCTTAAIAGYAVANKARSLIAAVYQNSTKANTNFIAQALGAGKIDKIKQGIKIGFSQGLLFFGVTMGFFMIFAKPFSLLFLDPSKDSEAIAISVNTIVFLFPFIIFNVFNNLFHGIFRAVGSGRLMLISTMIYAVSYVIYAYVLFAVLPADMRIYGVHLALSGAYITEVIFATVIFFTGKWKSPRYKELEEEYKTGKASERLVA